MNFGFRFILFSNLILNKIYDIEDTKRVERETIRIILLHNKLNHNEILHITCNALKFARIK